MSVEFKSCLVVLTDSFDKVFYETPVGQISFSTPCGKGEEYARELLDIENLTVKDSRTH